MFCFYVKFKQKDDFERFPATSGKKFRSVHSNVSELPMLLHCVLDVKQVETLCR